MIYYGQIIDILITDEVDTWHSSPGDTAVPSSGGSALSDTVHHSDDHDDHGERHDEEESSGEGDGTTEDDEGGDDDDGWGWGRQLPTGYKNVLIMIC